MKKADNIPDNNLTNSNARLQFFGRQHLKSNVQLVVC